ncbi:NUDIX domain-containing protein, partial [Sinorhizobium medicae]
QMERAQDAARREAQEESGLSIHSIRFLCISEQLIEAERQHWVSLIYVTEDFSGEPRLTEPDKLSDIRWFDLTALPQPLSRFAADAIRALA